MDYIHSTARFMGLGIRQRLRYWRIHSPAIGNRRGGIVDSIDPRTKFDLSDHLAIA